MNRRFAQPAWHLVDAKNKICGRLATQIVTLLRGKHKPNFTPWYDCGDYVVVINAQDVHLTGDKIRQKNFIWHTGYPGGLKQRSVRDQLKLKPEEVKIFLLLLSCIFIPLQLYLLYFFSCRFSCYVLGSSQVCSWNDGKK